VTRFTLEATAEEAAFGFRQVDHPNGQKALVVMLAPGVRAVKMLARTGTVEYAICDDDLRPLYVAAKSLDELRARFGR
jgi:hypothetical protein